MAGTWRSYEIQECGREAAKRWMMDILAKLADLHKQATTDRSHFYVARCCQEAMAEIAVLRAKLCDDAHAAYLNYTDSRGGEMTCLEVNYRHEPMTEVQRQRAKIERLQYECLYHKKMAEEAQSKLNEAECGLLEMQNRENVAGKVVASPDDPITEKNDALDPRHGTSPRT
jgi:hypothetical protein